MNYNGIIYKSLHLITRFISKINWRGVRSLFNNGRGSDVIYSEQRDAELLLRDDNYFILTEHKTYLSTYFIRFMTWVKTGKWPRYCHILMNVEVDIVTDKEGFDLMEATNSGVHWSTFDDVFTCDNFCILKAKNVLASEWATIMIGLNKQYGKSYDDFFNIKDSSHVSCVEMCLLSLKELPDFELRFPNLAKMVKDVGNLTPQMYRDCLDFEVVYETNH